MYYTCFSNRTSYRGRAACVLLTTVAGLNMASLGCSGIDGLPDAPRQVEDSGADSANPTIADAATDAADSGTTDAASVGSADATVADANAGADATLSSDATVDSGPCVPEDEAAFCTRLGKNCGTVTANDNCGARRTVASCGVCGSYYDSCGGAGVPNTCGCTPESDWSFCTRLGRTCGNVSGTDNCGNARAVASCGGICPPDAGAADSGAADSGAPDASVVQRWTFTNCGATGANGPTQAQCDAAYTGTTLASAVTLSVGIQTWTIPAPGRYRITAMGAQGGGSPAIAGLGASISSLFDFGVGAALRIVVGQSGLSGECTESQFPQLERGCGGGGGGTFVADGSTALLVAGGGGGSCTQAAVDARCPCSLDGNGSTPRPQPGCGPYEDRNYACASTSSGRLGSCGLGAGYSDPPNAANLGINAQAGGGGGFETSVYCAAYYASTGQPFTSGAGGGGSVGCRQGGFGGGGGGGGPSGFGGTTTATYFNGGGGGGGYSGGSGGSARGPAGSSTMTGPGSGGSSFTAGEAPQGFSGNRSGHGLVVIERIP